MSKIPKQAKKVFGGEIFEVYQWKQKMYDGSTEIFEMLKRPDTALVIPTVGNKILLNEEEQPILPKHLRFIGGRVDKNEEPLDAAKRELLEEAGFSSDDWELFATYEPVRKIEWKIYVYIAKNCKKTAEPKLDSGEKIEIREFNFEDFIKIVTASNFKATDFANDILRMKIEGKIDGLYAKLFPSS